MAARLKCAQIHLVSQGEALDRVANHGLVCHPGVKAMKATLLEKSLEKSFRVAGGNPSRQPSTFSLLGGYFTKEDLSSLFPGRLNGAQAEKNGKLAMMEFLDIIMEIAWSRADSETWSTP